MVHGASSSKDLEALAEFPPSYPQSSRTLPVSGGGPAAATPIGDEKADAQVDTPRTYACITLEWTDTIRFIQFPPDLPDAMRSIIQKTWSAGIQKEGIFASAYEFKLRGVPWSIAGAEPIHGCIIMCEILEDLYHKGWELLGTTDIAKDKDTLMFRSGLRPVPSSFFAISFADGDTLRVLKAPFEVLQEVRKTLGPRIQREGIKEDNSAYDFKLFGWSWYPSREVTVTVRILLLSILEALSAIGWELHASVNITNFGRHTWFLRKAEPAPRSE